MLIKCFVKHHMIPWLAWGSLMDLLLVIMSKVMFLTKLLRHPFSESSLVPHGKIHVTYVVIKQYIFFVTSHLLVLSLQLKQVRLLFMNEATQASKAFGSWFRYPCSHAYCCLFFGCNNKKKKKMKLVQFVHSWNRPALKLICHYTIKFWHLLKKKTYHHYVLLSKPDLKNAVWLISNGTCENTGNNILALRPNMFWI